MIKYTSMLLACLVKPMDAAYSNASRIYSVMGTILQALDTSIDVLCDDLSPTEDMSHLHDHAIIVYNLLLCVYVATLPQGDDQTESEEIITVCVLAPFEI